MDNTNSNRQALEEQNAKTERNWIYHGKIISLCSDHIEFSHKPAQKWDIVVHPGAVAILPIDSDGHVLLIKQWRRAAQKIMIEIPAGTLEPDEDPLICAQRELQEETGYKSKKITHLGGFYTAPGFCTEYIELYLAENLSEDPLEADDTEAIDLIRLSLEDALKLVDNHSILDSKTITALLQYDRRRRQL